MKREEKERSRNGCLNACVRKLSFSADYTEEELKLWQI